MRAKRSHGGKRHGAGRPKLPVDLRPRLVGVRLYPVELQRLRALGCDSDSAALRLVLAQRGIVQRNEANVAS